MTSDECMKALQDHLVFAYLNPEAGPAIVQTKARWLQTEEARLVDLRWRLDPDAFRIAEAEHRAAFDSLIGEFTAEVERRERVQ